MAPSTCVRCNVPFNIELMQCSFQYPRTSVFIPEDRTGLTRILQPDLTFEITYVVLVKYNQSTINKKSLPSKLWRWQVDLINKGNTKAPVGMGTKGFHIKIRRNCTDLRFTFQTEPKSETRRALSSSFHFLFSREYSAISHWLVNVQYQIQPNLFSTGEVYIMPIQHNTFNSPKHKHCY